MRAFAFAAFVAPLALVTAGTGLVVTEGGINYEFYPSQAATYGGAITATLGAIDRVLGGVAMLPGQIVFCLRYGAPHATYWNAVAMSFFVRDQWSLRIASPRLNLADPNLHAAMPGFLRIGDEGARVRARGTLVFCAEWFHATHLLVSARSTSPVTVHVSRRSFFGKTTSYGSMAVTPEETAFKLEIPPGGFDSGIEELIFETEPRGLSARIRWVELVDEAEYAPVK
jgi:hypothetical protein